jgi:Glycoside hydrolase family 5 C-terminal domain
VRTYPQATAGTPVALSFDPATGTAPVTVTVRRA